MKNFMMHLRPTLGLKTSLVLCVEPDYLLYSKVPPHWTLVQNGGGNAARKIFAAGGVQGGAAATFGSPPPGEGFRGQHPRS